MRGADAALLYMETPHAHMHTLKIAVFDPPPASVDVFESARDALRNLLPLLPGFRRRVVELPFGFHHPVWLEDGAFDLDVHLKRARIEPPGGDLELDQRIGEIASTPLPRDRPLWELWVLDGLADGSVVGVLKIHHALADGMAAAHLLERVLARAAGAAPDTAPDVRRSDAHPSRARLLLDAVPDHLRQIGRLPELLRDTARNLGAVLRARRNTQDRSPLPLLDTPRTPFTRSIGPRREFASASIPLASVVACGKRCDATVNDVMLSLVAGSLRRYLQTRNALPARPLVVEVPVATDDRAAALRLEGNRISNLFTWLRSDLADPVERLAATHRASAAAKAAHQRLGPDLFERWCEFAPPLLSAAMRWGSRLRLADRSRPVVDAIVSNVPGPRESLYWGAQRLRRLASVGPILEGIGLNLTCWSYAGQIRISALACPDRIDGLREIVDGIALELMELESALRRATSASGADAAESGTQNSQEATASGWNSSRQSAVAPSFCPASVSACA